MLGAVVGVVVFATIAVCIIWFRSMGTSWKEILGIMFNPKL